MRNETRVNRNKLNHTSLSSLHILEVLPLIRIKTLRFTMFRQINRKLKTYRPVQLKPWYGHHNTDKTSNIHTNGLKSEII